MFRDENKYATVLCKELGDLQMECWVKDDVCKSTYYEFLPKA